MSQLRTMIREILIEELGKLRSLPTKPQIHEEIVSIKNNSDLSLFVCRILEMAQDGRIKADIVSGRHVFKLTTETSSPFPAYQPVVSHPNPPPQTVFFETGLITEKDVSRLPPNLTRLDIGKTINFTPLARDELRRKGIKIERRLS